MLFAFKWWLALSLLNLLALPLTRRLFPFIPGNGYPFSRPLGLLLTCWIFWLGCSFGFIQNSPGGVIAALALASLISWKLGRKDLRDFWSQERPLILATELIHALAFASFALFKAFRPEISGTEKPMELAFLNAILRSPNFPPHDPWLSGFAISYYYFGYVMVAFLAKLTATPSSVAFNLAIASLFALTVTSLFGVVYGLIKVEEGSPWRAIRWAFMGAMLVAVMGNQEGFLELLHCKGIGSPAFWEWIDIKGLAQAPPCPGSLHPVDFWWWWRASRVIHDRNLLGQDQEVIDEFPFFSFLLGDLHPHVLALPFAIMATGLALNIFYSYPVSFAWSNLFFYSLILGGLGFLNTWDFPIYLAFVGATVALAHHREGERAPVKKALRLVFVLGALGVALYIPFYVSFRSQAGGILPVIFNATKVHQYFIMFAPFILAGPALFSPLRTLRATGLAKTLSITAVFLALLCYLFRKPLPALLIPLSLIAFLSILNNKEKPSAFALLLWLSGLLLTLTVEFVYVRDLFGTRMNTVFKLYYQAWVLMGLACAFALYRLSTRVSFTRTLWRNFILLFVGFGFFYPLAASATRAFAEGRGPLTLDGTVYLKEVNPADYEAILWLNQNVKGVPVILEATGGSYTYYGRVSTHTGLPTILGWDFHEFQWRGSYEEPSRRKPDISRIYTTPDPEEAKELVQKYNVRYIYIGPLERETYRLTGLAEEKFSRFATLVYDKNGVKIFVCPFP
ncbi:MAG: DUF2298 domain-containing protein [Anaerolineae bacterium]|nr:DUF2298 domain-containing protein [Anaerolineae bacterium]